MNQRSRDSRAGFLKSTHGQMAFAELVDFFQFHPQSADRVGAPEGREPDTN